MVEIALEICRRVIAAITLWTVILLIITPVALLVALWQRGSYWPNVRMNYVKALEFCDPTMFL